MSDLLKIVDLPVTSEGLRETRQVKGGMVLSDYVETIHLKLWEKEKYRRLCIGLHKPDTVEGSVKADNLFAANEIREYAKEQKIMEVAKEKAENIAKALNIVRRRYPKYTREAIDASRTPKTEVTE